jgi:hypothetical protein
MRVANIASVKMRTPFLKSDRGMTSKINRVFRQAVRRHTCESTMVITNNIRLERILLHSRATSTVSPGIETRTPSREAGTPTAENSNHAAMAEPCCSQCTILTSKNEGMGTIQKRKHRGKIRERETPAPKQMAKAPIHIITKASIAAGSRKSELGDGRNDLLSTAIRKPAANRYNPALPLVRDGFDAAALHSEQIKAALIGRIRIMCVYESSCRARENVLVIGRHEIAAEKRESNPQLIA